MSQAFVLLSGGIDSSTCLALAVRDFGAKFVTAITINYGQRHLLSELSCAVNQVNHHKIFAHEVLKIENVLPSLLTDRTKEIPDTSYDKIEGVSPMYVPFRNGQMLSMLAGFAAGRLEKDEKDNFIYFGAHAEDAARWAYPDCTPEFIGAMANAIYVGTYGQLRLKAPLEHLVKHEIIELGQRAGVPWEHTWSCYKGGEAHCGTCATCQSRKQGFIDAHVQDPTRYLSDKALELGAATRRAGTEVQY